MLLVVALGVLGAWWFRPATVRHRYETKRAGYIRQQKTRADYAKWEKEFRAKSARAQNIFAGATKVETFRLIDFRLQESQPANAPKVDGYFYSSKDSDQNADFAKKLAALVLNPNSYSRMHWACTFNPAIAFRVSKDKQTATVLICFHCNQLALVENDPQLPLQSLDGPKARVRFMEDIDLFRPEFIALAKEAFPNDKEIQQLETYGDSNKFLR